MSFDPPSSRLVHFRTFGFVWSRSTVVEYESVSIDFVDSTRLRRSWTSSSHQCRTTIWDRHSSRSVDDHSTDVSALGHFDDQCDWSSSVSFPSRRSSSDGIECFSSFGTSSSVDQSLLSVHLQVRSCPGLRTDRWLVFLLSVKSENKSDYVQWEYLHVFFGQWTNTESSLIHLWPSRTQLNWNASLLFGRFVSTSSFDRWTRDVYLRLRTSSLHVLVFVSRREERRMEIRWIESWTRHESFSDAVSLHTYLTVDFAFRAPLVVFVDDRCCVEKPSLVSPLFQTKESCLKGKYLSLREIKDIPLWNSIGTSSQCWSSGMLKFVQFRREEFLHTVNISRRSKTFSLFFCTARERRWIGNSIMKKFSPLSSSSSRDFDSQISAASRQSRFQFRTQTFVPLPPARLVSIFECWQQQQQHSKRERERK